MANRKIERDPKTLSARKALYKRIFNACANDKMSLNAMAFIAGVNANTIQSIRHNKDMSLYGLIRLANVLGFDVVLAAKSDHVNWKDDEQLVEKYKQFKIKSLDAKRKQRGQPTGDLPIKIRVKRSKGGVTPIISRSGISEIQFQQSNIFGAP